MTINLTRFYIDFEIKEADFKYRAVEDVETVDADDFEAKLKAENLSYTRTDIWWLVPGVNILTTFLRD